MPSYDGIQHQKETLVIVSILTQPCPQVARHVQVMSQFDVRLLVNRRHWPQNWVWRHEPYGIPCQQETSTRELALET